MTGISGKWGFVGGEGWSFKFILPTSVTANHLVSQLLWMCATDFQSYYGSGVGLGEQKKGKFSSVQFSRVWLFVTPRITACQTSLSISNSMSLPKPMSIESVMPFNHLILCHSLLLPSIFPSIRVLSNESALHIRWPQYWSFNFNISPSNEHPGLISFRMDWLDLLAVQRTLMTTWKNHRFG